MPSATRKIGMNRGKPRLWIEGKLLIEAGLPHGTPWTLIDEGSRLLIHAGAFEGALTRKVAGKPDRPVIDIVGASLDALRDASGAMPDSVTLTFDVGGGAIAITPTRNALRLAA